MLGFSMVQTVRQYASKLDSPLRNKLVNLYRPFRWVPCFLHKPLEKSLKLTKRFPVIIEFEDGDCLSSVQEVEEIMKRTVFCEYKHYYSSISCCSVVATPAALEELLKNCHGIKKIHDDRTVQAFLNVATPTIGSNTLHQNGLTGEGVTIAVLDTGIYTHPDLADRITTFVDFINNREQPYDDNGHGTHCAGDAAGNGTASNGLYMGPAPGANVIGVKVLDKLGSGSLSTVIAGVDWCIQNKERYGIDIISMSLGSTATGPAADDPMVRAVERAWNAGIVVCVAAGNEGPRRGSIASPGISPRVITVGAMDDRNTESRDDDIIADFSSRGPTSDQAAKPDLLAPGVAIVSLRSPNSYLDKLQKSNRVANNYFVLSGTSMATPICAGAVALILQHLQSNGIPYTPDSVKLTLLNSVEDRGLHAYDQGRGYLDLNRISLN